ncbi:MAG TPA: hypothetical protein VF610_04565, partial [Segetibacter sp.]
MTKEATSSNPVTPHIRGARGGSSAVLELRNVPTELILFAVSQWTHCGKYAKTTNRAKATNNFLKGIAVWLILKNETSSGKIKYYRSQLTELAGTCKMSVRTLDKYIAWLRLEGLVQVEGKHLVMQDYSTLKKYGINIKKREQTILYDIENKTSLPEILVALAIGYMQQRWMKVYWN